LNNLQVNSLFLSWLFGCCCWLTAALPLIFVCCFLPFHLNRLLVNWILIFLDWLFDCWCWLIAASWFLLFPSFLLEWPAGKLDFYLFWVDCLTVVFGSLQPHCWFLFLFFPSFPLEQPVGKLYFLGVDCLTAVVGHCSIMLIYDFVYSFLSTWMFLGWLFDSCCWHHCCLTIDFCFPSFPIEWPAGKMFFFFWADCLTVVLTHCSLTGWYLLFLSFCLNNLQINWISTVFQVDCLTFVVGVAAASQADFCFFLPFWLNDLQVHCICPLLTPMLHCVVAFSSACKLFYLFFASSCHDDKMNFVEAEI